MKKTTMPANIKELEALLEEYLVKKAPALPDNIKEIIVKFGPWITLIMMIMLLPVILGVFGLAALLAPASFLGGANVGFSYVVSLLFSIATLVIEGIALPGLFKRQLSAWRLMFYSTLLGAVDSLIHLNIVGLIIGTAISLYILFQIKNKYK
jgi:hypothetical protein